eukprot:jgi/Tetstr1/450270/TSEL_037306.t1
MAAERGGVQLPELSWFKEEANGAERLLQRAVKGVLTPAELGGVGGGQPAQRTAEDNAQACARSRECAAELLGRFRGLRAHLGELSGGLNASLEELHRDLAEEEALTQERAQELQANLGKLNKQFSSLESSIGRISRTATHIGERLHNAETRRQIAIEALEIIDFMQHFSTCGEDFETLPPLFRDPDMLAEAAGAATKLLLVADEVTSAKHRVAIEQGQAGSSGAPDPPAPPSGAPRGSLEYAVARLQQYCNMLENRVVSRFDAALGRRSMQAMQECAKIMAEFNRETVLINRYISQLPMFMDMKVMAWGEDGKGDMALRLAELFKEVLSTVKEEVVVMESVFPSGLLAVETLIQRVIEQRVGLALEKTLASVKQCAYDSEAERLQDYLRVLTQTYQRTMELAASLEAACGQEVVTQAQALYSGYLKEYPKPEMQLLQQLYTQHRIDAQPLSLGAMERMMDWSRGAVQRCVQLSGESRRAAAVRALFHASSQSAGNTGCMLEQVARHLIKGLQIAADGCTAGCMTGAPRSDSVKVGDRPKLARAADEAVKKGVWQVLAAVQTAGDVVVQLQVHYQQVVAPHVAGLRNEETECVAGIAAFLKAAQSAVVRTLGGALTAFFQQLDTLLRAEQKRSEFLPPETDMMMETPTPACLITVAMLKAALRAAHDTLSGANLQAFKAEMAQRAHSVLLAHLMRFTFSQTGALRLKHDGDALEGELKAMVSILIISPASLLGVVDGSLRMSHKDALRFIQLREDFKTARVGGKSLAVIFASE